VFLKKNFTGIFLKIGIFIDMKKECKCLFCGETDENMFYGKRKSKCKKCLSNEYKNRPDKQDYIDKQKKWVNKNLIRFRVLSAKHRAIRDNLSFELTNEMVEEKLKEQDYKCYISKLPISMESNNWYSLSLDRINSDDGYTIKNTIIVTKFINISKNELSLNEFIFLIKEVCNNL